MTTRFKGSVAKIPFFPQELAGYATAAPSPNGAIATLVAANDRFIRIGRVRWQDGQTHSLRSVKWKMGSVTSANFTVRISNRAVDLANGPIGRDDGSVITSATQVNPTTGTVYNLQLSGDTSYAHGALIALVWDFSAYTSGSFSVTGLTPGTFSQGHLPLSVYYNGSAYAVVSNGRTAGLTLIADDGTLGILEGDLPILSGITTNTFNSGTSAGSGVGDEVGFEFTVEAPFTIGDIAFLVNPAASGDFTVALYEDTTLVGSFTVDANTWQGNGLAGWARAPIPDVALTTGHTYRLVVKPTTANNVSIYSMNFETAAEAILMAGLPNAGLNSRADAGSWGTPVATRIPICQLGISALTTGGVGPLVGPGLLVS